MQYLIFQVYAPLVSWGDIAVGGERQSSRQPSKSAIIGLISAALGVKREEGKRLDELAKSIGMAVQLHSGGSVLKDFHTTQVPKKINKVVYHTRYSELSASAKYISTILSQREYRCDSFSVIAIYSKPENTQFPLDKIEKALNNPHFHLYFGRKSCVPALPLAPAIIESSNLKEAFSGFNPVFPVPVDDDIPSWLLKSYEQYPENTLFDETNIIYFWEEGAVSGLSHLQSVERYDQPLSRKRWQFTSRREYMAMEKRSEVKNVHQ